MVPLFSVFSRMASFARMACTAGLIMLMITNAASQPGPAADELRYTLIPPGNCQIFPVEFFAILQWEIPDSSGAMPPGLLGYNIYRNGSFFHAISDPDSTGWIDGPLYAGNFQYSIKARYDLTANGYPGETGESEACVTDSIYINCTRLLPFFEHWDQGSFAYNGWNFFPSQGNWVINTGVGNPPPSASFNGLPLQMDYSFGFQPTGYLCGQYYSCADGLLSFDYMLEDSLSTGTEHLEVGIVIADSLYPLATYSNNGTTGWGHEELDIDMAMGDFFKFYFKIYGTNSTTIRHWLIDNIAVAGICKPVTALDYTVNGNVVNLTWDHPCDTMTTGGSLLAGYNVYRTDETGTPPFVKLNATPVVEQEYGDHLPLVGPGAEFAYCIRALFIDSQVQTYFCESPCDTLVVVPGLMVHEAGTVSFNLSPNPGSGRFTLTMTEIPASVEVCDIQGVPIVRPEIPKDQKSIILDLTRHPAGVYFIRLQTSAGMVVLKIIRI
jgi:hypothetical protein